MLSQQKEGFASITAEIASKESNITSYKESIRCLEASLVVARETLTTYEKHYHHLEMFGAKLRTSSTRSPRDYSPQLTSFMAINGVKRANTCITEAKVVKIAHKELRSIIAGLKEDIRCTRHRLIIAEMSLPISRDTRDNLKQTIRLIQEHFRAIKRVPDEIWMGIFSIVVDMANNHSTSAADDTTVLSNSLPLSQVCSAWRRIMLHAPEMWTTIYCDAPAGKSLGKRALLMDCIVQRASGNNLNLIDKRRYGSQRYLGCWWWPLSFETDHFSILANCNYHTTFSDAFPASGTHSFILAPPTSLTFEVGNPDGMEPISTAGGEALKDVQSLSLVNVVLRPPPQVTFNKMTNLKVAFNSSFVHKRGVTSRSYCITPLLGENIERLYLSHYESNTVTWNGSPLILQHLHSLFITPNELHLVPNLVLPSLKELTIGFPHGYSEMHTNEWIQDLTGLCRRITSLTLDWTPSTEPTGSVFRPGMAFVFGKLWAHTPKLDTLAFIGGTLDGEALYRYLDAPFGRMPTVITIDKCVGISEDDCQRMRLLICKLNVHRCKSSL